jgi:SAGA-associated factor 29
LDFCELLGPCLYTSLYLALANRKMSRNRPRPRDNGFGNNEELELWTKICQDIRKSKEKFDQQASLSSQIKTLVDKIGHDGNSECPRTMEYLEILGSITDNTNSIMRFVSC